MNLGWVGFSEEIIQAPVSSEKIEQMWQSECHLATHSLHWAHHWQN